MSKGKEYEKLTPQRKQLVDMMLENLNKPNLKWMQEWIGKGRPKSASTGKEYRGINALYLYLVTNARGYKDNRWVIEGIPELEKPKLQEGAVNERAEKLLQYWSDNESKIYHDSDEAFYRRRTDEIHLPSKEAFTSLNGYYSTAFHEVGHSTGNEKRLNRDLSGEFGSESYAIEELRAEIASIFLEQDLGIEAGDSRLQNNAAYIQSWKEKIKEEPNALFAAIADADKISKYIMERERESGLQEVLERVEQEKSEEYAPPSEMADVAKSLPVDMTGRGKASLTRMSDVEVFNRAEKFYEREKEFGELYQGKTAMQTDERSEYALMARLANFCGEDKEQLMRLFQSSGQFKGDKPLSHYEGMASRAMKAVSESKASPMPTKEVGGNKGKQNTNAKR